MVRVKFIHLFNLYLLGEVIGCPVLPQMLLIMQIAVKRFTIPVLVG